MSSDNSLKIFRVQAASAAILAGRSAAAAASLLFKYTVELLHPLTHLRSVLRHFSLIQHNRTVARASVLWPGYGAI